MQCLIHCNCKYAMHTDINVSRPRENCVRLVQFSYKLYTVLLTVDIGFFFFLTSFMLSVFNTMM